MQEIFEAELVDSPNVASEPRPYGPVFDLVN